MKGGKDMKKIYKLDVDEHEYKIVDEGLVLFSILKSDLEFDGNKFYEAFFEKNDNNIEIELEKAYEDKEEQNDKILRSIYEVLNKIFSEISIGLMQINSEEFLENEKNEEIS